MTTKTLGRPSKLTPEIQQKIVWALRLGNYRKSAAEYAGVSERTLCDWMRRGTEETHGAYADFCQEVVAAEQAAEIRALGVIQQAAKRDWKAAAWFLERKHPERYCVKAAILLAKRLPVDETRDLDALSAAELDAEVLRCIGELAQTLPRDQLLAAINGKANAPRVIDVDVEPESETTPQRALRRVE